MYALLRQWPAYTLHGLAFLVFVDITCLRTSSMAASDRKKAQKSALNIKSQKDWHTLCSEYNLCKRKLQAKKDALLILAEELDNVRQEKDAFRLMAEQLREKYQALKKQCADRERALGLSLNESDPLSERRNHSLVQVLRESREQNKKAEAKIADLEQNLAEAQGDIKLLRENIARQRIGDDGIGTRHFPAHEREELVNQLEAAREQLQALERDLVAKIDEQTELVTERGYFRDKADRLNQELNYVLGGDEKRIVDIDALTMETKYLKERLKQAQEEKSVAQAAVAKYKAAIERRRGKHSIKLGSTSSGGLLVSPKQVEQLLAEGKSGGIAATPSSVADLQSLATALLETIHDKNMAVNHHRNTNKILGNRVAELEKKLKTLEISGLWNLPPGRNAAFVASEVKNMMAGQSSLVPRQASNASDDSNLAGLESGTSLPESLDSSTQSSPSHCQSSLHLGNDEDKNDMVALRHGKDATHQLLQVDDIGELMHQARDDTACVHSGSMESPLSTDDGHHWHDTLTCEHRAPVELPPSTETADRPATPVSHDGSELDMEEPKESDSLLDQAMADSPRLGTDSSLDLDPELPSADRLYHDERTDMTELSGSVDELECLNQEELDNSDIELPSYHTSNMPTMPTELQESLDTVGDLLETVSDKLSCRSRELLPPRESDTSSPGSGSPLLSRDRQVPVDKSIRAHTIGPVDTAPHCV
ncbi:coiled-coil domain-containing protein 149-like [Patiria miniata]|uniref:Coiled-coil domain-containing protein 149 n=1 Tax=Patiria miniata TaxID=46514 RepID=A0A914ALS9_PATMI|nr:coiled-coil domain-containing protein 149-like [Patiria miniata]